ncbi:MAG: hydroxyacid dehydrogenase [Verrucomicrobiales bacterium]|nr:hydroxyacid dehydrogenase [Verrucomicrobiales bacterium]|tara:strand:+ start:6547 stop:7731 length:1185 start_codon:yes stop_codon:yes gene_type:complete
MDWGFIISALVKAGIVFGAAMTAFAYAGVMAERKISAAIQDRIGPNRVPLPTPLMAAVPLLGPILAKLSATFVAPLLNPVIKGLGLIQPAVDGVKAFTKEDYTPEHVNKVYFWIAPMIVFIPSVVILAVIPFGSTLPFGEIAGVDIGTQKMVIADLNVGILFSFGIVSLSVYGIVLAGWASNSKFPFLGGIRASAQMVSYELAMGLSIVPIFLIVGELNLSGIINYQAENSWLIAPYKEHLLLLPSLFLSCAIFTVAIFAETNRLPFDLPEAETELVSGYNTEYGSMKFAMFFMGEYIAMIAGAAMIVTLFLGGWTLPFGVLDDQATSIWAGLAHIGIFVTKVVAILWVMVWVRWMMPRFRYDQLMDLGWRTVLPIAIINIGVVATILFFNHVK